MNHEFDFKKLFVLDMANNHQGILSHGKNIITEAANAVEKSGLKNDGVRFGIKFQFRDLPNFIHIEERKKTNNKHVPRFLSTMLTWDDYFELANFAKSKGFLTICTPFDENSVDRIQEIGFDILKIASCSANDWPLLEKSVSANLPIIASTGGLVHAEIDKLVSFLTHRGSDFSLMHCVSIYPTASEQCNLSNIRDLKRRYRNLTIGWSTHENQDDTDPIIAARALGAEMFERHIGLETDEIKLNGYSSNPEQLVKWFSAFKKIETLLGFSERQSPLDVEVSALNSLKRGVFAKSNIKIGQQLTAENTYFAFPCGPEQTSSSELRLGQTVMHNIEKDKPILNKYLNHETCVYDVTKFKHQIHKVKAILNYANIKLGIDFETEFSHHYGRDKFSEIGTVLISVLNREYAKKILVQLPNQKHPAHFHKLKEETFIVIWGSLDVYVEGELFKLRPGQKLTVPRGAWHSFSSESGCVFEEISTTAIDGDSFYKDENINKLSRTQRKTKVDNWGRFEI